MSIFHSQYNIIICPIYIYMHNIMSITFMHCMSLLSIVQLPFTTCLFFIHSMSNMYAQYSARTSGCSLCHNSHSQLPYIICLTFMHNMLASCTILTVHNIESHCTIFNSQFACTILCNLCQSAHAQLAFTPRPFFIHMQYNIIICPICIYYAQ